mmetsp:Transcript_50763/g.158599  ORF Transcript_50763/g.158599 Transcript_50763/m.158599 type:complete len:224 (+) Transcript_50763:275-946(+)
MIPPNKSLVKYDNPVLLANASKSKSSQAKSDAAGSPSKNEKSHSLYQPEEILNAIIPPREWNEGGQVWVQHVSSSPATRLDVVNLQELLDNKLQQRKARETGICPVREELYKETFDEIIRQVTVNCAERGLLMIRVRDEIQMTRSAYQTLYESSIAFGIRKVLQAKQNRTAMRRTIERLLENNETLREEISMLKVLSASRILACTLTIYCAAAAKSDIDREEL